MVVLGSIFQSVKKKSMVAEALEEYALSSSESAYEDPGQQAPIGSMASGVESCESGNDSHWLDQKQPSFTSITCS